MSKTLVVSGGGHTLSFPVSTVVRRELLAHGIVFTAGAVVGTLCGHPGIGALIAVGFSAACEVAEFFLFKSALKSGRVTVEVR